LRILCRPGPKMRQTAACCRIVIWLTDRTYRGRRVSLRVAQGHKTLELFVRRETARWRGYFHCQPLLGTELTMVAAMRASRAIAQFGSYEVRKNQNTERPMTLKLKTKSQ
jgi:hypothetical protein